MRSRGGKMKKFGFYLVILLMELWFSCQPALANESCEICKLQKNGEFYGVKSAYHKRTILICKSCYELTDNCAICALPVLPKTGVRLPDKRVFCPDHAKTVVLNEEAAAALFSKARDEAMDLLRQYPPLPQFEITFHMVTREDFVRVYRRTPGIEDPYVLLGLTHPLVEPDGKASYHIYVVHGLSEETFLSTCAHEYAHTWVLARGKPTRLLHKDTEEGVCEWIAHKVVSKFGMQREVDRILANSYTRGQVSVLLAAEKEYGLYKMIRWITDGVDSWVDAEKLSRVLVLRETLSDDAPPFVLNWGPTKPTQAPDRLILKGLSGTSGRRFALINDATLEANEEAKVRVGITNMVVRCLVIHSNSVQIQVRGERAPRTLLLGF
jgi:hypothetical protein